MSRRENVFTVEKETNEREGAALALAPQRLGFQYVGTTFRAVIQINL